MFFRKIQRKFLAVLIIAVAFPAIALIVTYLNEPKIIKEPLPLSQPYKRKTVTTSPVPRISATISPSTPASSLPPEINLAVPFTSQSPYQNWELPYSEFCEEASTLIAASYINRMTINDPAYANKKLLEVKSFEEARFGYYQDTNAEETAIILREFFKIDKVSIVYDPKIEDIKKALAGGRVVIIPAAGRLLHNPYFQQPGPLYHMLVIKGYTKTGNFITNDPGTRHGADYIYAPDIIMNAIHDWNGGDVTNGRKVMIVVG